MLGVCYATLTYNCHNLYAGSALIDLLNGIAAARPYWGGISKAGRKPIRQVNRLGMIVDPSYVITYTMRDVLGGTLSKGWKGSLAPPIFSHSSAYTTCPHPRNVSDDVLGLVKARNHLVMVTFSPDLASRHHSENGNMNGLPGRYAPNLTLSRVVRRARHIGHY
jgi:membrane dipeptidase